MVKKVFTSEEAKEVAKKIGLDFFASDFISDYDIIILGVTTNGSFVTQKKSIKIQK